MQRKSLNFPYGMQDTGLYASEPSMLPAQTGTENILLSWLLFVKFAVNIVQV
jgi:hypothetical protein